MRPLTLLPIWKTLRWLPSLVMIEMKKLITYRVDFWVRTVVSVFFQVLVAYFLWSAVFEATGNEKMGGYTLHQMLLYYVAAGFIFQIVQPGFGWLSRDIYEGTITRFLVYPVPFFTFQYASRLSNSVVVYAQLLLALPLFYFILGWPPEMHITMLSFIRATVALFAASIMYFTMATTIELVAFWVDSVWTLILMLRFIGSFLGGKLIPLSFFPGWAQVLLPVLPFPYCVSFPIRSLFGAVSYDEWLHGLYMIAIWTAVFSAISSLLWQRGLKQYTAVGQ